jgi:hypothetical protein
MSKMLRNVAIGAGIGTVAAVVVTTLDKRATDEPDKPLLPPGVSVVLMAALAGLDPLFKAALVMAKNAIDQVLEKGDPDHDDTDEEQEDGGDDEPHHDDEPQHDGSEQSQGAPALGEGPTAGPGDASTPA